MKQPTTNTHTGTLNSVSGNKISSTCGEGKEHHHTVTEDVKVTHNGKSCGVDDLKIGAPIRVTTSKDDDTKVTAIDSGKRQQFTKSKV